MTQLVTEWPQFITCTIRGYYKLLVHNEYKKIILESLHFLVRDNRVKLFAFVIMPDHIHLIWQMQFDHLREEVQRDFLKYTAQQIKFHIQIYRPDVLRYFQSGSGDRIYHFWKRRSLSIDLFTHRVFLQKLDYIHWNPVKAGLCRYPETYHFSSALFYETGIDNWGFLTHYAD